jgi:CO/xanthine dehydrogenase Mo-binding subunit
MQIDKKKTALHLAAMYTSDLPRALGLMRFPSDIYAKDCLFGVVVRSPNPHCIINKIDVSRALRLPGVITILTAEDIPGVKFIGKIIDDTPILIQLEHQANSSLDAVCLIAAESEDMARKAIKAIEIEFEPLQPVFTVEEALKPGAPIIHEGGNIAAEIKIRHGDIARGFAEADVTIENTYRIPSIDHAFMETEAAFAETTPAGIRVFVGSQNPYQERELIAKALNLEEGNVEIIDVHTGGGFGGKDDSLINLYCSLLAWKTKRPVRMNWSRPESFRGHSKRHPMQIKAKTGAKKDGRLTAMQMEIVADTGSYAHWGPAILKFASLGANGVYDIPNTCVDTKVVYTNNIMSGAMRAWGNQAVAFVVESQIDQIAAYLNIHPLRMRWINAIDEESILINGKHPPKGVGAKATIQAAAEFLQIDLDQPVQVEKTGIGFAAVMQGVNYHFGHQDSSEVRIELGSDDVFEIYAATSDIGQGLEAEILVLFCRALGGLPIDRVRWMPQSTATSPNAGATGASRHTGTTANAIWGAAKKIQAILQSIAAEMLDTPPNQIEVLGERIVGSGMETTLDTLIAEARKMKIELKADYKFIAPATTDVDENGQGFPVNQYSYETLITRVQVNVDTGEVTVGEMVAFVDAGHIVNPLGAAKQVEGGCVMGLGYALTEEFLQKDGMPWTRSLSTFLIPTVIDAPVRIKSHFLDRPIPLGEVGGRGLAEVVVVAPAPSIINAIANSTGAYVTQIPATPERVFKTLEARTTFLNQQR